MFHSNLDPSKYEDDPELEKICEERGYTFRDFVNSEKIPNLEEKLDHFKTEHLHDDDEIRYFLKGSGYFDVKNKGIRFAVWLFLSKFCEMVCCDIWHTQMMSG